MPPIRDTQRLPPMRPMPWAVVLGYFAVFLLLDWASFIRPLQHLNITPWNPQPALAVALLLASRRLWWVVWASLLVAEVLVRGFAGRLLIELASATALTCSYLVIAELLRRVLQDGWRINGPRVVAWLIGVIAFGALLSGTAYVGLHALAGLVVEHPLWEALARYWVGEVVGMVVVLPVVLAAMDLQGRLKLLQTLGDRRWWAIAGTVVLLLAGLWRADPAFGMDFSYLLLLPAVWGATLFGAAGALLTAAFTQVGLIVTVEAVHHQDLIVFELQMLMAAVTITSLLLGVVVDERQRADAELRRSLRFAAAGQMSAALAHELSQPLTALATYAQACKMMLQGEPRLGDEAHAQLAEVTRRIGEDAIRAGDIVRRLRDFFRSGATQLRPTALGALVEDALAAQSQRAVALGVQLHAHWPATLPMALADSVQMEVVLRNLVTNAVEASAGQEGARGVTVRGSRIGPDTLLVEVLDTGPGVPAARALQIFDGVESDKPGGMGVGLSICRAIVEAHGGRLWVEAGRQGHFCLTLPADTRPDDAGATSHPSSHAR